MSAGLTAESAVLDATRLTAAQRRGAYDEFGYLVFPGLLDQVEIGDLRRALGEVLDDAAGLAQSNDKFSIVPSDSGNTAVVRRIRNPIAHHHVFLELVFNPKILDVVANLIGEDIQLHHTKLNLKPASALARFEWHQDYAFIPHTNFDLLAVMVTIDEATEENGCLRVIPRSHKMGPTAHVFGRDGAATSHLLDGEIVRDRASWLSVPMRPGDVELHHCNLLHGSEPTRTDRPRSAMVIQYRAADNAQVAGSTNHFGYGMQVRGSDPNRIRMVAGCIDRPVLAGDPFNPAG
jgi:ectoine hydroxylase-related dioxygenase (phytanoyl-CoA dioxygenase family)